MIIHMVESASISVRDGPLELIWTQDMQSESTATVNMHHELGGGFAAPKRVSQNMRCLYARALAGVLSLPRYCAVSYDVHSRLSSEMPKRTEDGDRLEPGLCMLASNRFCHRRLPLRAIRKSPGLRSPT